jgi:hypothetical protein
MFRSDNLCTGRTLHRGVVHRTLVKANFEESTAAPLYDAHLEKLRNWHELNPTVVDKILETLFKRCRSVTLFTPA